MPLNCKVTSLKEKPELTGRPCRLKNSSLACHRFADHSITLIWPDGTVLCERECTNSRAFFTALLGANVPIPCYENVTFISMGRVDLRLRPRVELKV